jgi:uncharacterized membrane protein
MIIFREGRVKRAKPNKLWDSLHSSYWFLPSSIAVAVIASRFRSTIKRQLDPSVAASLEILYPNVNLPIPGEK